MIATTTKRGGKPRDGKRPIKPIRRKDALFKIVGKLRAVYLALAREYLPPKWLKVLDLDGAELIDTVSVDSALRERLGDLVLRIPFASGNGNLILGMEQQTQGVFTPARALEYQVRFLRAARKAGLDDKPVVACTLVLFSDRMPSSQGSDVFAGLSPEEKRLARGSLGTIIPVELGKIPDERLRAGGMAELLELFLKHERGKPILPLLEPLWPRLRALKKQEDGREFVEAIINYALLAAPKKERDGILSSVEKHLGAEGEEVGMTVASALIQEGLEKGLKKGRLEGRLERSMEIARGMLSEKIPAATVAKLTGLSLPRIKKLRS